MKVIVSVHIIDGKVFRYQADNPEQARDHASAIIDHGYMHQFSGNQVMEFYPPSSVLRVRISGLGKYPHSRYAKKGKNESQNNGDMPDNLKDVELE